MREEGFDGSLGGSAEDDDVVVIGVVFVWGFVAGDEDTPGVEERATQKASCQSVGFRSKR